MSTDLEKQVFDAAWHDADRRGLTGQRVRAGLDAVDQHRKDAEKAKSRAVELINNGQASLVAEALHFAGRTRVGALRGHEFVVFHAALDAPSLDQVVAELQKLVDRGVPPKRIREAARKVSRTPTAFEYADLDDLG